MNFLNSSSSFIEFMVDVESSARPSMMPSSFLPPSNFTFEDSSMSSPSSEDFVQNCYTKDTMKLLCENIEMEVPFNCSFPINASTINDNDKYTYAKITQLSATGIAFVVALVGNLLVVIAASFDVTLRSPVNMFLVNLSLADILVSIVCLWDNALRSMSYNYMLGPIGCKAGGFIHMACLFVSVLTLAGIALDRVYAVLLPFHARHTPPRPKWVISLIWALSTAAALPFSALREYRVYKWQDFTEIQCTYSRGRGYFTPDESNQCELSYNYVNTYHMMVTILLFFIPVFVILLAYFLIILKLWKTQAFVEHSRVISKVHINAKKKVVRLALIVLTAFLVCWTPLQALILMSIFGSDQSAALSEERHLFWIYFVAYSNSALNPLIYGGFSKSYRATLLRLLRRGNRRNTPSVTAGRSRGTMTLTIPPKSDGPYLRQRQSLSSLISAPLSALNNNKKRPSPPFVQKEVVATINDPRLVNEKTELVHIDCDDQQKKRSSNKIMKDTIMMNTFPIDINGGVLSESKKHLSNKLISDPPFRIENLSIVETDFNNKKGVQKDQNGAWKGTKGNLKNQEAILKDHRGTLWGRKDNLTDLNNCASNNGDNHKMENLIKLSNLERIYAKNKF